MSAVLPGAEPFSAEGGPTGVLFVHGFTGSPSSLRDLAHAAAAAGHSVELPLLPGHGTSVEDLDRCGWPDWVDAVVTGHDELSRRVDHVVVVALSAGGAWSVGVVAEREVAGFMAINPFVMPLDHDVVTRVDDALASGVTAAPGDGPDIAKEGVAEVSYDATPLRALLRLNDGLAGLAPQLARITAPVLIATSRDDRVISPANSDHLAAAVSGPVTRMRLERSRHVATQDHDQPVLISAMLTFVQEVTS